LQDPLQSTLDLRAPLWSAYSLSLSCLLLLCLSRSLFLRVKM
jgi:hypothetical protein